MWHFCWQTIKLNNALCEKLESTRCRWSQDMCKNIFQCSESVVLCSLQQRIEIIINHNKNGEDLVETVRKTKLFFGRRDAPRGPPYRNRWKKLSCWDSLVINVYEEWNTCVSLRNDWVLWKTHVFHSSSSLQCILQKDSSLKAYKVQLTQEHNPADHKGWCVFANWVFEMHENNTRFHRKFILTEGKSFRVISQRGDRIGHRDLVN